MRIIVGADFVPTEENFGLFEAGDIDALFGKEIKQILSEADYRIFNLECALTDEDTPLKKAGVCLRAPTATIEGYRAAGVDMLGIANNHVLDHGYEGFLSTVNTIDKAGIAFDRSNANGPSPNPYT